MAQARKLTLTVQPLVDAAVWRVSPVGVLTVAKHPLPSERLAWSAVLYVEGYVRNDHLRDAISVLRESVLDRLGGPWHLQVNVVSPLEVSGLSKIVDKAD